MKRKRLLVVLGGALAALVGLATVFLIRRPPVDLSVARDRIELGMTEAQVLAIVGRPAGDHTDFGPMIGLPGPKAPGGEVAYRLMWAEGGVALAVEFGRDGRVVDKEWWPHWDVPLRPTGNWLRGEPTPGTAPAGPAPGTAPQHDGS